MLESRHALLMVGRLVACLLGLTFLVGFSAHASYQLVAKWGSRGSGDGEFNWPDGVAVDSSGDVYVADRHNHRIQKFTSSGTFLTKWGSRGSGDGEFNTVGDIAIDAAGNVYVVDDVYNHRIQKLTSSGTFLTEWGSYGSGNGQFDTVRGIAVDAAANVYVVDSNNSRIQKFTSGGTFLTKWGSYGGGDGQFNTPVGVATDAAGRVYVTEHYGHRIQKFRPKGGFITKWGSYGIGDGQFIYPGGVAVDGAGNVYVADAGNDRIQKFTSNGTFLTKWGSLGSANGQFRGPGSVAVDAVGNVYVADVGNYRIQKFAPVSLEWAGTTGYTNDGVHPNRGSPNSTTFTFKVKYTDARGGAPRKALCVLHRRVCSSWKLYQSVATMAKEGGDVATGAIYACSMKLPNDVFRYKFRFRTADGAWLSADPPCRFRQGPRIIGGPLLCWSPNTGYKTDGVKPNSGAAGTKFRFEVLYQDSAGDQPTRHELLVRRNGTIYTTRTMAPAAGGSYRIGKIHRTSVALTQPGAYEYRSRFADASGVAHGPPNKWTAGPTITGTLGLTVPSLAAVPTATGAQLTFTLTSDANVTATVLNIAGRPVKTICTGRDCEAGTNTLLWNAQSDRGLPVPNGTYLVELMAKAGDGGQARALTQVTLRR